MNNKMSCYFNFIKIQNHGSYSFRIPVILNTRYPVPYPVRYLIPYPYPSSKSYNNQIEFDNGNLAAT
jgi:hypothetical protein